MKGEQGKHFIVGPYHAQHPFLKSSIYKLLYKGAINYAIKNNLQLAEGPTEYLPDNDYGPVELWPLVWEGR